MRIGVDTGGTFTDLAVVAGGRLQVHKLPSTPADPARAVLDGIAELRGPAAVDVVHGTTVGLNALLTGNVARTALVTNAGFVDLIEIGRQARSDLYDLGASKPVPPVPRALRFAVRGRRLAGGAKEPGPSPRELAALVRRLRAARVEAVAVGLLYSHLHAGDEHAIAHGLRTLGIPITCSGDLLPSSGEYERFTAAILNAAISPIVGSYVQRLERGVQPGAVRLMRSSGGAMSATEAARYPARAMLSGPAGGVLAARRYAQVLGLPRVATLDMGGTSTDVSLVGEDAGNAASASIAGLPLLLPAVDVHTIGCGGGSIARVDPGGALQVGPESAGADPGPACYGKGDEATVTDAHVALGHLGPDTLLSGAFPIDPDRSVRAIERLARRLGVSPRHAATGILEVAQAAMRRALLVMTVQRSIDPARVPLFAFGGAGGLHAAALARALGMPGAVVAPHPGAFSAIGLALAGEACERSEPLLVPLARIGSRGLVARGRRLARRVAAELAATGAAAGGGVEVVAELRYAGQGEGLRVRAGPRIAERLAALHRRRFGFVPDAEIEVVAMHARAESRPRPVPRLGEPAPARAAGARARQPPLRGPRLPVYARSALELGQRLPGPCVIEELTGVTLIPGGVLAIPRRHGLLLRLR
jgi:N-methylhydantoinase A